MLFEHTNEKTTLISKSWGLFLMEDDLESSWSIENKTMSLDQSWPHHCMCLKKYIQFDIQHLHISKSSGLGMLLIYLHDALRMFLIPSMMSVSDFECTNGFVLQTTYNLMYQTFFSLSSKCKNINLALRTLHYFGVLSWLLGRRSIMPITAV